MDLIVGPIIGAIMVPVLPRFINLTIDPLISSGVKGAYINYT